MLRRYSCLLVTVAIIQSSAVRSEPPARETKSDDKEQATPVDRYGDALPRGAVARLGTVRFRHPRRAFSLAYAPDGKTIASAGGRDILLWDVASGKEVYRDAETFIYLVQPRLAGCR